MPKLSALVVPFVFLTPLAAQGLVGVSLGPGGWPHPAAPAGNPFPQDGQSGVAQRDKVAQLGKTLFWEEQVSTDNTVACGTCHVNKWGGTDPRLGAIFEDPLDPDYKNNGNSGSFGVLPQLPRSVDSLLIDYGSDTLPGDERQVTEVAAPTMIGAYLFDQLFWDMRAGPWFGDGGTDPIPGFELNAALEALAVEPPVSSVEMGHATIAWGDGYLEYKIGTSMPMAMVDPTTIPTDVQWIVDNFTNYNDVFDDVFFGHPQFGGNIGVTRERFAMAVAHYQRTLIPDGAPVDLGTMTEDQEDGFLAMREELCFTCHSHSGSPVLVDGGGFEDPFDNLLSNGQKLGIFLRTGDVVQDDRKVPTLRNLGLRRKFFSNGSIDDHQELIDFYLEREGEGSTIPNSALVFSSITSERVEHAADFMLNALTDPRVELEMPPFDRPRLYSEGVVFGANLLESATAPPGGVEPSMIANSPPLIPPQSGPQWVKLGVCDAVPGEPTAIHFSLSLGGPGPLWLGDPVFTDLGPVVNSEGFATYHQPAPMNPSLIDVSLYFQWQIGTGPNVAFTKVAELVPF